MKTLLLASLTIALFATIYLVSDSTSDSLLDEPLLNSEFQNLLKISDLKISNREELRYRYEVYKKNKKMIEEVNAKKLTYTLGFNNFSLFTFEEFSAKVGLNTYGSPESIGETIQELPEGEKLQYTLVDWRNIFDVTPVKNQTSYCNAGYAMASAGALEALVKKYRGQATPLSSQQIIDCTVGPNFACKGGYATYSLEYMKNKGLTTENNYRYTATQGACNQNVPISAVVKGYFGIPNENQIAIALNSKPVILAYEINSDLQHYSSGVYMNRTSCGSQLNHFSLGVGYYYNTQNDSYWIIKNSFGTGWGVAGYLYLDLYSCGAARNQFSAALSE